MTAVTLGPLVLSAERFAVLLGLAVFLVVTGVLSRRVDRRFDTWSWWVLIAGVAAARLGHVAVHWRSFAEEPLRAFALWEGGFFWPTAAGAIALLVGFGLRTARLRLWALVPLAAALFTWNVTWHLLGTTPATPVPDTAFPTLDGRRLDLSATDRPQVVNLWATWCPPCRREMPMMADVAAAAEGVDVIFANQGESGQTVTDYLSQAGLTLDTVVLDSLSELSRHYGTRGLPVTLFIDTDGTLRDAHLGEISREVLQSGIQELNDR